MTPGEEKLLRAIFTTEEDENDVKRHAINIIAASMAGTEHDPFWYAQMLSAARMLEKKGVKKFTPGLWVALVWKADDAVLRHALSDDYLLGEWKEIFKSACTDLDGNVDMYEGEEEEFNEEVEYIKSWKDRINERRWKADVPKLE